jgi:thiol-disulfide isomerase/thioredoxin
VSELDALDSAEQWLNSEPLTAEGLRGKVVLVQFWTYTCINWIRTMPYVRAWAERYEGDGLVVVGVHTPEFPFEHRLDNVREAVRDMRVEHPVAIDNNYAIWGAFDNHYWPALYFVDAEGRVRDNRFGEGEYERSERVLQQLLTEAGAGDLRRDVVSVSGEGVEAAADWGTLGTPETYLSYGRSEQAAEPLKLNEWSLSGGWTVTNEAAVLTEAGGRIAFRFHARDLHLVMGPPAGEEPVPFQVVVDGQPPDGAHGVDVDKDGKGQATRQRLYQLIRQGSPIVDRTLEIRFLAPGIEAYAFTFG